MSQLPDRPDADQLRRQARGLHRAADSDAGATPPPVRSWEEMRDWAARLLLSRTGEDVQAWNRRVTDAVLADEQALRSWLAGQGVTGYSQALLVRERFGYPDFMTTGADELIEAQYADRPRLRPDQADQRLAGLHRHLAQRGQRRQHCV